RTAGRSSMRNESFYICTPGPSSPRPNRGFRGNRGQPPKPNGKTPRFRPPILKGPRKSGGEFGGNAQKTRGNSGRPPETPESPGSREGRGARNHSQGHQGRGR